MFVMVSWIALFCMVGLDLSHNISQLTLLRGSYCITEGATITMISGIFFSVLLEALVLT